MVVKEFITTRHTTVIERNPLSMPVNAAELSRMEGPAVTSTIGAVLYLCDGALFGVFCYQYSALLLYRIFEYGLLDSWALAFVVFPLAGYGAFLILNPKTRSSPEHRRRVEIPAIQEWVKIPADQKWDEIPIHEKWVKIRRDVRLIAATLFVTGLLYGITTLFGWWEDGTFSPFQSEANLFAFGTLFTAFVLRDLIFRRLDL